MRWWGLAVVVAVSVVRPVARVEAKTNPDTAAIAKVIDDQFAGFRDTTRAASVYAKDAMVSMTGGTATPQVNRLSDAEGKWTIFGPAKVGKHKVKDLRVVVARDKGSAWASFVANVNVDGLDKSGPVDFRVTELFVQGGSGWQILAAAWSIGVANAALAKAAKAQSFAGLETVFDQNLGDKDVIGALLSLVKSGLDASASGRTDVLGVDTAPGTPTVGGKKLAAKIKKEWVDKVAIDGHTWALTTGTTACATANVKVDRAGAAIPARLFAVFEKDSGGAWSPVLVHLAAALPR